MRARRPGVLLQADTAALMAQQELRLRADNYAVPLQQNRSIGPVPTVDAMRLRRPQLPNIADVRQEGTMAASRAVQAPFLAHLRPIALHTWAQQSMTTYRDLSAFVSAEAICYGVPLFAAVIFAAQMTHCGIWEPIVNGTPGVSDIFTTCLPRSANSVRGLLLRVPITCAVITVILLGSYEAALLGQRALFGPDPRTLPPAFLPDELPFAD